MKTLFSSLLLALTISASTASFANTDDKMTAPASYQVGMYASQSATKLNVMIAKEKGATVRVQVLNEQGEALATEQISKYETGHRVRFDLSQLKDGKYQVVVTDGASKTVKEINLQTNTPVKTDRLISLR